MPSSVIGKSPHLIVSICRILHLVPCGRNSEVNYRTLYLERDVLGEVLAGLSANNRDSKQMAGAPPSALSLVFIPSTRPFTCCPEFQGGKQIP